MKRFLLAIVSLAVMATTLPAAGGKSILLVARDFEGQPLAGLRFSYAGIESGKTNGAGSVELAVPADHETGRQIKILLLPSPKRGEDWFLVNSQVNIPSASNPAEVVLMKRSAFRKLAAEVRDAPVASAKQQGEPTAGEERKRALIAAAARCGLTQEQLGTAISSFGETQDPRDQGIAAFLAGQYPRAEALLRGAVEKKEADLVETLRYLGASQYEQAKYEDAVSSFRKAIALRSDDPVLLSRLGLTLHELARSPSK